MQRHGFPVEGLTFEWDDAVQFSPEQTMQAEQMLLQMGYQIPAEYFRDRYGINLSDPNPDAQRLAQLLNLPNPTDFFG